MSNRTLNKDPRGRARAQSSGSAVQTLLQPLVKPERRGTQLNHAQINRQQLKAVQVRNQLKREEAEMKALEEPFKMNRFKHVQSVVKQQQQKGGSGGGSGEGAPVRGVSATKRTSQGGMQQQTQGRRTHGRGMTGQMAGLNLNGGTSAAAHHGEEYGHEEEEENIYAQGDHAHHYDDHADAGVYDEPQYDDHHGGQHERYDDEGEESLSNLLSGTSSHSYVAAAPRGVAAASSAGPRSNAPSRSSVHAVTRSKPSRFDESKESHHNPHAAAAASASSLSSAQAAGAHRHENYGKVPAYIVEAKQQLEQAKAAKAAEAAEKKLGIPPGMILMPEEQRLQTLKVLQENHAKVLHDLACFPLRVETISRKKAKAELEAKLEEIDKAITLFSRKRVLIQP